MRIRCHLREIRGETPLRAIAAESGVNAGELSRIETGQSVPHDRDIEALEAAYGAHFEDWYPKRVLVAMELDDDEQVAIRARLRTTLTPKEATNGR